MHTRLCFCIFTLIRRAGARDEGGGVGVRVRVPVRGCCSDIFLTICILHTPWPGKRNENGGNDLLISEVCAHTYIHTCTYVLYEYVCVAVWSIDRNLNWYELCRAGGVRAGREVWSMDWLWKWKRMHVTSACECIINIILVYRTRHLPKIPLRHHIRLLFSVCTCVSVCACVCVCVKIYGVLENCVRRTLKVCQKICRKTRKKQIYMRRRSLCIKCFVCQKSFKELLASQRAASAT